MKEIPLHGPKAVGSHCCPGKQVSLGLYEKEEDAALAYNEAALEAFGEYARLNAIERE